MLIWTEQGSVCAIVVKVENGGHRLGANGNEMARFDAYRHRVMMCKVPDPVINSFILTFR